MTPLQKQICARLLTGGDVSSIDARRVYAKDLGVKTVSPGSIHRALRSLVDLHVLTKPAGSRGHYGFDDPMFREWLSRQTSDSDDAPNTLANILIGFGPGSLK